MVYIFSLLLCFYLAWQYDLQGGKRNKERWYIILLIWFICVSGFQYHVGVDIYRYEDAYSWYYKTLRFDLADMEGRLQPGWVLLSYCCRQISSNFLFFKIIQAIFINVSIFCFFKRETKYPFVCVFLYAISSYLLLNFNILRQSFALGFVLFAISFYKREKYLGAVALSVIAFLFHNSAFIVFLVPLVKYIKFNKKVIIIFSAALISVVVILLRMDYDVLFTSIIESGILGDNISELGAHHLSSEKFSARDIQIGITRFAQIGLILSVLIVYIKKSKEFFFGGLSILYLLFVTVNFSIPILFRFRLYFDAAFFVVFATTIIEYPMQRFRQIRQLIFLFSMLIFSYFPYREYMIKYEGTQFRYIDQYYPYNSIFNPDPVSDNRKRQFFGL